MKKAVNFKCSSKISLQLRFAMNTKHVWFVETCQTPKETSSSFDTMPALLSIPCHGPWASNSYRIYNESCLATGKERAERTKVPRTNRTNELLITRVRCSHQWATKIPSWVGRLTRVLLHKVWYKAVVSVDRATDHREKVAGSNPGPDQYSGSLNNWGERDAFAMTSANGY